MAKRNVYSHCIELKDLNIKNAKREEFAEQLRQICYQGYKVEDIANGKKIVISKPGGKSSYGRISKEDFFVFIYNPQENTLWQITHKQIYEDLEVKSNFSPEETLKILEALKLVYEGEEPDEVLKNSTLTNPIGEEPEVILKAYKWIWGQEDVNYPTGYGRRMSFEGWVKKDDKFEQTEVSIEKLYLSLKENHK